MTIEERPLFDCEYVIGMVFNKQNVISGINIEYKILPTKIGFAGSLLFIAQLIHCNITEKPENPIIIDTTITDDEFELSRTDIPLVISMIPIIIASVCQFLL